MVVNIQPEREAFNLGEPIVGVLTITNVSSRPIYFTSPDPDRDFVYQITASTSNAQASKDATTHSSFVFDGFRGIIEIEGGKLFTRKIFLDNYCNFNSVGSYKITIGTHFLIHQIDIDLKSDNSLKEHSPSFDYSKDERQDAMLSCVLNISPKNTDEIQRRFSILYNQTIDGISTNSNGISDYEIRRQAAHTMSMANATEVIPFLEKMATNSFPDIRREALQSLKKHGSDGVASLKRLADYGDPSISNEAKQILKAE